MRSGTVQQLHALTLENYPIQRSGLHRHHVAFVARAVLGIDLGTSNSAVAIIQDGDARIVNIGEDDTTPSWVAFTEGDVITGRKAQRQALLNSSNTFSSVKRLIGRPFTDIHGELQHSSYDCRPSANGGVELWCPARQMGLSPAEVSSHILRQLIECAEDTLGEQADAAVITVPAYFNAEQKEATLQVGRAAGLSRIQLLQEPVAASLTYGLGRTRTEDSLILVFDLGGGTFDISLVECFEGCMEVLATGGDARLGGNDWDSALLAWVLQQQSPAAQERVAEPSAVQRLLEAVEAAKRRLSAAASADIDLPFWDGERALRVSITRRDFEAATEQLRRRLWPPLQRLGHKAFLQWADRPDFADVRSEEAGCAEGGVPTSDRFAPAARRVTQVVLVGGATHMPQVRELVARVTGIQPQTTVNPAHCVALGAAIYAGILEGTITDGPELADGSYSWDLHARASGFCT